MSIEKYNKEQIRDRILKNAATSWGVRKAVNFDPVVKIMFEGMANEIYMLGQDFTAIETRLLEKMAQILTPDILTAPFPAHGVMHALPLEKTYLLTKESGVYYENEALTRNLQTGNLPFYPACNVRLHNADVKYMVCNNSLYQVDHMLEKTMIARANRKIAHNSVWIALTADEQINNLRNFSFYIDFPDMIDNYEYLYLLPCTEWSVKGRPMTLERGISLEEQRPANRAHAFFNDYDSVNRIDKEIITIYNNRFLTVTGNMPLEETDREKMPETLIPYFDNEISEKMERMIWIQVLFPPHFTGELLEKLQLGTNVVPIENKLLHEHVVAIGDTFGVIPLQTGNHEFLLSVHSVRDADGKYYHELQYDEANGSEQNGTYSLRKGGCERFDSRSAKEMLVYLQDLLDNETKAFSAVSSAKIQSLIAQMEQLMAQMKQTTDNMNEYREVPTYLMIDGFKGKGMITVKYWTTNCELGNDVQAGVSLQPNTDTYLDPKALALVATTYGGRQEPKNRGRIDLYKYSLSTHGRILTNNDIAAFCKKELGELLEHTEIRNGVEISRIPKEGLIRTKEIHLILTARIDDRLQEERMKGDLKTKLEACSPDTFRYRIFIDNK